MTYLVATNVARNRDGSSAGINVKTALSSILHLDYGTCAQTTGRQVLCRVGDVATTDEFHFWSLLTSEDLPINTGNFDDLTLNAGSVLRMAYTVDTDHDGLFDVQENLYGTDIDNADTDGDGQSDFAETQTGWTVPAIGPAKAYQVYPSPLAADLDGDASPDGCNGGAPICGLSPYGSRERPAHRPEPPRHQQRRGAGRPASRCRRPQLLPRLLPHTRLRSPAIGSGKGDGDGEFGDGPGPIAGAPGTGDMYVADRGNNRIERFGANGTFKLAFGTSGKRNWTVRSDHRCCRRQPRQRLRHRRLRRRHRRFAAHRWQTAKVHRQRGSCSDDIGRRLGCHR